jgi:hypothetical protein
VPPRFWRTTMKFNAHLDRRTAVSGRGASLAGTTTFAPTMWRRLNTILLEPGRFRRLTPSILALTFLAGTIAPGRSARAREDPQARRITPIVTTPAGGAFRERLMSAPSISGTHRDADAQATVNARELDRRDGTNLNRKERTPGTLNASPSVAKKDLKGIAPADNTPPDPTVITLPTTLRQQSSADIPDFSMAASASFIVSANSLTYYLQDLSGNILSSSTLSSFFAGVGSLNPFAPKILHDDMSDRFVIAALDGFQTNNSSVLLAVSDTSDPTGSWTLYRFAADPQGLTSAEVLSSIGVNSSWIVLVTGMFQNGPPNSFVNSNIYAIDKNSLLASKKLSATRFQDQGYAPCPTKGYDTVFPIVDIFTDWNGSSNGQGFIRHGGIFGNVGQEKYNPAGEFIASNNTWSSSAPSANLNFLPQLGSSTGIYGGDAKITNAVFRNNTLYATHSVYRPAAGTPTHMAVHWVTEDAVTGAKQDGFIEDPTGVTSYAFPSIAVDFDNDVLIANGVFSKNAYPGSGVSIRYGGDSPDLAFRPTITVAMSSRPYVHIFSGDKAEAPGPLTDHLASQLVTGADEALNVYGPTFAEALLQRLEPFLTDDQKQFLVLALICDPETFWESVNLVALFLTYNDPTFLRDDFGPSTVAFGPPKGTDTSGLAFIKQYPILPRYAGASVTGVEVFVQPFIGKVGDSGTILLGTMPDSATDPSGVTWDVKQPFTVAALGQRFVVPVPPYPLQPGTKLEVGLTGFPAYSAGTNQPPLLNSFTTLDLGIHCGLDSAVNIDLTPKVTGKVILEKAAVDLSIFGEPEPIDHIGAGRIFAFKLTATNLSDSTVDGLTIDDPLPDGVRAFALSIDEFSGPPTHPVSPQFSLGPHSSRSFFFGAVAGTEASRSVTNIATLSGPLGTASAQWSIMVQPAARPFASAANTQGKEAIVGGYFTETGGLSSPGAISGAASGPVMLIDGAPQKTVPDAVLPNNVLIAPKGAKHIKPGQTVTIQVQFPDGATTNSITYTRPSG